MSSSHEQNSGPERPPEFGRRVVISGKQLFGLACLVTLPVLALCGMLGDRMTVLKTEAEGLRLVVSVPACARRGCVRQLRVEVETDRLNASAGRRVRVELGADYLDRFSDVAARPEVEQVRRGSYVFRQELAEDGRGAPIVIDLTPERYGWARGRVAVSLEDGAPIAVTLETFVFP